MSAPILVTGAAGYIGQATVARLRNAGIPVRALTRRAAPAARAGLDWIERPDGLPQASDLDGCQAVIHLAGRAHTGTVMQDGVDLFDAANHLLARDCALAARQAGVARFVLVSTLGVHGNVSQRPIDETSPLLGDTPYARAKIAGEDAVSAVLDGSATRRVTVRPPMIYGPHCPGNFSRLLRLVQRGLPLPFGSVRARRSFMHVDNLADFLAYCAADTPTQGLYTVADGSDYTLPQLIGRIGQGLGQRVRLLPCPPGLLRALARLAGKTREVDSLTRPMLVDWRHARASGWTPPLPPDNALDQAIQAYATPRS